MVDPPRSASWFRSDGIGTSSSSRSARRCRPSARRRPGSPTPCWCSRSPGSPAKAGLASLRASRALRAVRPPGRRCVRPLQPQVADDLGRRRPGARARLAGRQHRDRARHIRPDPDRRLHRGDDVRHLQHRGDRRRPLGRTGAAAPACLCHRAGADVERLPRRAAARRRALRARAIAAVPRRRDLVRVLDGNAARDADAVPGGAGRAGNSRPLDTDQGRARLALGTRLPPHLCTALRRRELPLRRARASC